MFKLILRLLAFVIFILILCNNAYASNILKTLDQVFDKWSTTELVIKAGPWEKESVIESDFVNKVIPNVLKLIFELWAGLAVLGLVYTWAKLMTEWDSKSTNKAWKSLWFIVTGLIIMLLSRWIVWLVENIQLWSGSSQGIIDPWSKFLSNLPSCMLESDCIARLASTIISIISIIIIGMVMYAWGLYLFNYSNTKNKDEAVNILLNCIIWLWICIASYVLVQWVLRLNFTDQIEEKTYMSTSEIDQLYEKINSLTGFDTKESRRALQSLINIDDALSGKVWADQIWAIAGNAISLVNNAADQEVVDAQTRDEIDKFIWYTRRQEAIERFYALYYSTNGKPASNSIIEGLSWISNLISLYKWNPDINELYNLRAHLINTYSAENNGKLPSAEIMNAIDSYINTLKTYP